MSQSAGLAFSSLHSSPFSKIHFSVSTSHVYSCFSCSRTHSQPPTSSSFTDVTSVFLLSLSPPRLSHPSFFVNSVVSPRVKWKVGDTRVQIAQLAMAGEKKRKAISTPFLSRVPSPLLPGPVGTSRRKEKPPLNRQPVSKEEIRGREERREGRRETLSRLTLD